jgi:hypothetical protein
MGMVGHGHVPVDAGLTRCTMAASSRANDDPGALLMDDDRFDRLTRALAGAVSRRALHAGFALVLGLSVSDRLGLARAKNKNNKKKPRFNDFGCLDVGKKCNGKNSRCCSNVCQGKKPKEGKKDKSRCVAHSVGGCQPGEDSCAGVDEACGTGGLCFRTTGKAGFCGAAVTCMVCRKDTDCHAAQGAGAACVVCESCIAVDGSRTACTPPRA